MDHFYLFVVASLGVWRITHLVTSEAGPWRMFARVRHAAAGRAWAGLVDCFYCSSVWMSIPFAYAIGSDLHERVLLWSALSGAAIAIERLTARTSRAEYVEHAAAAPIPPQALEAAEAAEEEGDRDHVMLRKEHESRDRSEHVHISSTLARRN